MEIYLLIAAVIGFLCVAASRISKKVGVPALLIFLVLGMVFGSDGLFRIEFSNFEFAESICSVALLFIMFYGGFGTNWKQARPVAAQAVLLSTAGVALTAGLVGVFCHYVLRTTWLEGLLIGSVISSTDAASVFSILRTKKLNLAGGLASLLEVESGSNDPVAFLLTTVVLGLMSGEAVSVPLTLVMQIVIGLAGGFLVGKAALLLMQRVSLPDNMTPIFVVAVALLAYGAPVALGGNGYLSVYITGILLGNQRIPKKAELVHFFDGVTGMMQILLFFLLGLLCFPSQMLQTIVPAVFVALFLTLVARPAAVSLLLTPFKVPFRQQLLVSWAGLRGAASIVFAILAVTSPANTRNDIFHIVFCICLLSVAIQGTLLPMVAHKLKVIDENNDIQKTFNDFQEENDITLIEAHMKEEHPWVGKDFSEIVMPGGMLAVMLKRGKEIMIPRGHTRVEEGDTIVIGCTQYYDTSGVMLQEKDAEKIWEGKTIQELNLPKDQLLVMIRRDHESIIPKGSTKIKKGDMIYLFQPSSRLK